MNEHSPMRLAKREIRDPEAIRQVVDACKTVRIGTMDEEGVFIVPMSFGYDCRTDANGALQLTLWLHSAGEGRKARAFAANSSVAVEMDIEDGVICGSYSCSYSYAYRSVMGSGTIVEIEGDDAKAAGLARIMEHMAPGASVDFTAEALARCSVWRVDVEHLTCKQRAPKKQA